MIMNLKNGKVKAERLEERHISAVAEIEAVCFGSPWSETSLRLLLEDTAVGFAVCENGRAVAYGGMLTVLDEGQITNVAVLPECRGRGYARAVMKALEEYALEKGIKLLSLEVRESNSAAMALYDSLGFERAGLRKGFYSRPVESAVVMIKRL